MVEANDLIAPKEPDAGTAKLANVTELSENGTAKVTFFGEDTQSQKEYSYLANYKPNLDDIVLMYPISDTYIIIGKVNIFTDIPNDIVTHQELATLFAGYVTNESLNNVLSGYLTQSTGDNRYAPYVHTHSTYVTDTSVRNYIGWNNSNSTMNNSSSFYNNFSALQASNKFYHSGSYLGFFGTTPAQKTSIADQAESNTTSISQVIHYINTINQALHKYGLT